MLDKLSKNLQGLIYQYLLGLELLRCEGVSRKVAIGSRQDYIWRYLSENHLEVFRKYFSDSWKECYWRNCRASDHMSQKKFNYMMCPIRHFKNLIKYVDTFNNFVFAADDKGQVGIFLINEKDMENDDETLQVQTLDTPGVAFMKYIKDSSSLFIVTDNAKVLMVQIDQQAIDKFEIKVAAIIELGFTPSLLYVCSLDNSEEQFFISNFPLDGNNFTVDQTVLIFNTKKQSIDYTQKIDYIADPVDYLSNACFNIFAQNGQRLTLQQFKEEKHQRQLAVYDGYKLVISLFLNQFLVIETQLSKLEIFFKKTNYSLVDPFPNAQNTFITIDMKKSKDLLITFNVSQLNIFSFDTLQLTQNIPLVRVGYSLSYLQLSETLNELTLVQTAYKNICITQYVLNYETKQLLQQSEHLLTKDFGNNINDVDTNKHLIALASAEGNIQLKRLNSLSQEPYYINAGSRAIKTNISHPLKAGVNMVKVNQSKIIAVLGNVIRVYSFDIQVANNQR